MAHRIAYPHGFEHLLRLTRRSLAHGGAAMLDRTRAQPRTPNRVPDGRPTSSWPQIASGFRPCELTLSPFREPVEKTPEREAEAASRALFRMEDCRILSKGRCGWLPKRKRSG